MLVLEAAVLLQGLDDLLEVEGFELDLFQQKVLFGFFVH